MLQQGVKVGTPWGSPELQRQFSFIPMYKFLKIKKLSLPPCDTKKMCVLSGVHRNLCTFGIWEWWEHQMVMDISAAFINLKVSILL